jgi:hypothetical protein
VLRMLPARLPHTMASLFVYVRNARVFAAAATGWFRQCPWAIQPRSASNKAGVRPPRAYTCQCSTVPVLHQQSGTAADGNAAACAVATLDCCAYCVPFLLPPADRPFTQGKHSEVRLLALLTLDHIGHAGGAGVNLPSMVSANAHVAFSNDGRWGKGALWCAGA